MGEFSSKEKPTDAIIASVPYSEESIHSADVLEKDNPQIKTFEAKLETFEMGINDKLKALEQTFANKFVAFTEALQANQRKISELEETEGIVVVLKRSKFPRFNGITKYNQIQNLPIPITTKEKKTQKKKFHERYIFPTKANKIQ